MFTDNKNFYPTPNNIIDKMLQGIDFMLIQSVLEPSAGKGNILDEVKKKFKYSRNYHYIKEPDYDIDSIEIDEELQHILKGKNYRIIHDDFLTFNTHKNYDLIVMNPPFDNGDKHLLKALELQESKGGMIICLLNSETIKNPYTNTRKDLNNKLQKHNAEIEFINNAFLDAERKTSVEIALIKINIHKSENNSIILDELKKQESPITDNTYTSDTLINADFLKGIVEQYNFECKAGLKLIDEYNKLQPFITNSIKDKYNKPILTLSLYSKDEDNNCNLSNSYIKQLRIKYWQGLFMSDQFMGLFTSNLRQNYISKINELRNYDFSLYNIYTIKQQLHKEMIQGVEDTILKLFDEFSNKHYYDEMSGNIHYYNGWKTNKSWKINKKVIMPLRGYYDPKRLDYGWAVKEKLGDIEKVFNYLDNGITEDINLLEDTLKQAEEKQENKKIRTKYFLVTFFKKGTCHLEFRNLDLLHKFNLYGSQKKGWLPPSYAKKEYKDMNEEEKAVINDFEGETSYKKVMLNKGYYIIDSSKLLITA